MHYDPTESLIKTVIYTFPDFSLDIQALTALLNYGTISLVLISVLGIIKACGSWNLGRNFGHSNKSQKKPKMLQEIREFQQHIMVASALVGANHFGVWYADMVIASV